MEPVDNFGRNVPWTEIEDILRTKAERPVTEEDVSIAKIQAGHGLFTPNEILVRYGCPRIPDAGDEPVTVPDGVPVRRNVAKAEAEIQRLKNIIKDSTQ